MLTSYKNILYATDLSANSTNAFRHAVALAKQSDAEIHVLHAVEELFRSGTNYPGDVYHG